MKAIHLAWGLSLVLLLSCEKWEEPSSSIWYVNGKKYMTNEVYIEEGKAIRIMSTVSPFEGFSLTFYIGVQPGGRVKIGDSLHRNNTVYISILHQQTSYFHKPHAGLLRGVSNGDKMSYQLEEVWFYHPDRPEEDSILVHGVFSEP